MITPDELLDFTSELTIEGTRTEAYARRAVSAAYHALFHTLVQAGAVLFQAPPELQQRIARSYDHGKAARSLDALSKIRPVDPRLLDVARALTRLQELREKADYDLTSELSWDDVEEVMLLAINAQATFQTINNSDAAKAFVLEPLLRDRARRG